jgi:hypothetical protein
MTTYQSLVDALANLRKRGYEADFATETVMKIIHPATVVHTTLFINLNILEMAQPSKILKP